MIQKSRARLLAVGGGLIASVGVALFVPVLWVPCLVAALAGSYLVIWATAGKGRWCRQCKGFKVS